MTKTHPRKRIRPTTTTTTTTTTAAVTTNNDCKDNDHLSSIAATAGGSTSPVFNDPSTCDVVLYLQCNDSSSSDEILLLHLHSHFLRRSKYFDALLSDRWQNPRPNPNPNANEGIRASSASSFDSTAAFCLHHSITSPIEHYVTVLRLLYTCDFSSVITSATTALDVLPVALEFLFEDCVRHCLVFLEAVPWTEAEESRVLTLAPLLSEAESKELLARVSQQNPNACEDMLYGLILTAVHHHWNMAFVKAFVTKILRDTAEKGAARKGLERVFEACFNVVKEALEQYSSPDFRGDHNETEAIQRLNLHTAMTNGKHLVWILERMIELRVADKAVREWSEQSGFTGDLQKALRDEAWRNIVPGFPSMIVRCTLKIASAVADGTFLAAREVRMRLVKNWLPVLIACKDLTSPMHSSHSLKTVYVELEEAFLRIITTLPMSDAQELLQQCLCLSSRDAENCPHLVRAFKAWFRRASNPPKLDNLSSE